MRDNLSRARAMRVDIETAEGRLPQSIEAAVRGEDVVLAAGELSVARIVPIPTTAFEIGILAGQGLGPGPDFFEPVPDAELELWEGGR
ncbi:type II toxin-antitoxin system prevent-host-death family antitoxin [Methylobacterium sp. NEAU 140]|uniref:type II toxin-antitoxin system prevent-host-death family antitoxin n=1 Tax=Methylobacterium sp. NEAU 140 TaxID=3064945 RepID=UPI00273412D4|nr:type II toxin-antitoxin system prevent-host-death family antitoxin [Methylobacterium sp. NEAU 140]MDP4024094.1 type II toxin-antitoxin system prevent-host-death family antitoxin [Methylobacterium sp. NEAU 140]